MTNGQKYIAWAPQPGPQEALIDCSLPEVFFGGARGGGKTDGVLGKWSIKERRYGEDFNAMMFRRTTVSAEDAVERSKAIYGPLGGTFNESKLRWSMPNGGRVGFGYLDSTKDAEAWQGRNLTDVWVEEAGQYPDPTPIDRLQGVLRSAHGVPTQLILTGNPGGAGQHWICSRYGLYPFPKGPAVINRKLPNGNTFPVAVIPSRIQDNKALLENDPHYIDRLYQVGSEKLVKAWLEGDWSAVEGAFFDCWDASKHVVEPFEVPEWWNRFRSADWGSAKPFSIGWWAVVSDDYVTPQRQLLPRGLILRYREWYGCKRETPNVGLKLTAEEVAQGILEREGAEFDGSGQMVRKPHIQINNGVMDPSTFADHGGPSIADRMHMKGVHFRQADNKRVAQRGALGGWDQMRARMKGDGTNPMIACFSTCEHSIRTIPVLQHDLSRPEDLDTEAEDHAADDWRYACMSYPYIKEKPPAAKPRDRWEKAFAARDYEVGLVGWKAM